MNEKSKSRGRRFIPSVSVEVSQTLVETAESRLDIAQPKEKVAQTLLKESRAELVAIQATFGEAPQT
jgi:hypothetical protein